MSTLRAWLLLVLVSISATPVCAQSLGEDMQGYLLRKTLGVDTLYPFLDHDGLTFAQRELLYNFTVDPVLLQGPYVHFEHFDYRAQGFDWDDLYGDTVSRLVIQLDSVTHEWLTVDEFHRSLAGIAEDFATSPGVYYDKAFTIDVSLENLWLEDLQIHADVIVFNLELVE